MPATDFHCMFCGRARGDVRKLIYGPRVFICVDCVSACIDLLGGGALATFGHGSQVAFRPSGRDVPEAIQEYRRQDRPFADATPHQCSFCGKRRQEVQVIVCGYMDCVCCECVELCMEITAEDLGAEWNERVRAWRTKSPIAGGHSRVT